MTPNTTRTTRTTTVAQTPSTQDRDVAAALRDVAFVLQLTRRVKAEILGSKPVAARPQASSEEMITAVSA